MSQPGLSNASSSEGSVAAYSGGFLFWGVIKHPGEHHTSVGEETALSRIISAFSAVLYVQN